MSRQKWSVIVHGGAWAIPDECVQAHLDGVREACRVASEHLRAGGEAIDAVQRAIEAMEECGTFDAGRGSFLTSAGEVEMDSMIATGDARIGAVASIKNFPHPIAVARLVRDRSKHVLVVGDGAAAFARAQGLEQCDPERLLVKREVVRHDAIRKDEARFDAKAAFDKRPSDTVGCVCMDSKGALAVGLSTGGTPHKMPGRVGDSPVWGCGGFAEDGAGACAATGYGEDLIRATMSKRVVDAIPRSPKGVAGACQAAVAHLKSRHGGLGGVVAMDSTGNVGLAFNTPRMAHAFCTNTDPDIVFGI